MQAYTVELVKPALKISIEGEDVKVIPGYRMFCSGVWAAQDKILTAAHCTRSGAQFYRAYHDAAPVAYAVEKTDEAHDIALLKASAWSAHPVAALAAYSPPIGAEVHLMGHPGGLPWTYYRGYVAAYRPADFGDLSVKGPWLQVQAPVIGGSSGSAAYDSDGRIVGLCSRGAGEVDIAFYVHLSSIRNFLGS